ncbi:MAG: hypothetical protein J6A28_02280 [Clostridia bacterium]|nr:hypothetical protein [Clostridia bacterium]
MRNDCKEFLEDYISKHIYGKNADYDFYTLFKLYSAYEISCPQDITRAVDEFSDFLTSWGGTIFNSNVKDAPRLMKYSAKALHMLLESPLTTHQECFVKIIKDIAPYKKNTKILDVGAGLYPKASIKLANDFNSLTAIDVQFLLSGASMQAMNISSIEQHFDINTQIQEYDFIIGRRPCGAIEDIVKVCTKFQKPYFIELCNCCLPQPPFQGDENWGWEDVLPCHDPHITFSYPYAYNIGGKDIEPIIHKHTHKMFQKSPPQHVGMRLRKIISQHNADEEKENIT